MNSNRKWMPLYVADYLTDTRHLTTLQHGAYLLLIMEYWVKGRLPTDDLALQKICVVTGQQWRFLKPVLAAFFGPNWRHERVERELEKAKELKLKRGIYGARGGQKTHARKRHDRFGVVRDFPSKS